MITFADDRIRFLSAMCTRCSTRASHCLMLEVGVGIELPTIMIDEDSIHLPIIFSLKANIPHYYFSSCADISVGPEQVRKGSIRKTTCGSLICHRQLRYTERVFVQSETDSVEQLACGVLSS